MDSLIHRCKNAKIHTYSGFTDAQVHRYTEIDTQMKMYAEISRCSGTRSVTQMHKHIDAHCTDSQIHRCSHILIDTQTHRSIGMHRQIPYTVTYCK
jgi:hypothetical protein